MNAPSSPPDSAKPADKPAAARVSDAGRVGVRDVAGALGLDDAGKSGGSWLSSWLSWRGAALLVAVLAVLWIGYGQIAGDSGEGRVRYTTQAAKRGGLVVTVSATGTVEPTNQVEVSSELSGIVKSVTADFNDPVTEGQMLAELDTAKLEAQVAHSRAALKAKKAQVAQAEATVAETKRDLDRSLRLLERRITAQSEVDAAQASFDRAQAGLEVAKADVVVAEADLLIDETNLQKACICSPIDGVVLSRDVDPGQTVAASLQAPTLFTLAEDLASMRLEVDIDEADVGEVREGQTATFTVEAYQDRVFDAHLEEVRYASESTDDGVVTYTAVLGLDNSELLLRPGMTATADIVVQNIEDALLIPNAALRYAPPETASSESGGGGNLLRSLMPRPPRGESVAKAVIDADGARVVWVLRDEGPAAVSVRTGASDGAWTEVVEGELAAGDKVITDSTTGK